MKIYLMGYMGSGKSTLGKKLAHRLGFKFLDLDHQIEGHYKLSIQDIFDKYGETSFREMEKQALFETKSLSNHVISLGGGTPCADNNLAFIKNNGISIYIKMNPKALKSRLLSSKHPRPLIQKLQEEEVLSFIERHLESRSKYYEQADIIFDGINNHIRLLTEAIRQHPQFKS